VRSVKSVRILLAAKSAGDAAGGGVQGVCVGAVRPVAATGAARGRRDPRGAGATRRQRADRAQGFLPVPVVLACHPCCLRAASGFPRVPTGCGDAEVCVLCAGARDWEVVGGEFGCGWESAVEAGVCEARGGPGVFVSQCEGCAEVVAGGGRERVSGVGQAVGVFCG